MLLGLRTIVYPAPDLDASRAWYRELLGIDPYFEQAFYIGFKVGGYELGLDPEADPIDGPTTYWGVEDIDHALETLMPGSDRAHWNAREVGGGIRVATVLDPGGSQLGLIENPHFEVEDHQAGSGPGR